MQFTSMKILGGLALALMASSVVAAPTSAVTDISATPSATSPTVSGKVSDAAGTTGSFRYSEAAQNIQDYISSMTLHPKGIVHYSDDGVVRSYDGEGKVIDYRKLNNTQLRQKMGSLPPWLQNQTDHLHDVWDHVNGHDVIDEKQLWDPPAHLRPVKAKTPTASSLAPQSINPAHDIASRLDDRSTPVVIPLAGIPVSVCLGRHCSTNNGCELLGCVRCVQVDKKVSRQCE